MAETQAGVTNTDISLLPPVEATVAELYLRAELSEGLSPAAQSGNALDPPDSAECTVDSVVPEEEFDCHSKSSSPAKPSSPAKRPRRSVTNTAPANEYTVRFKGNCSKRWDGKDIVVDGEWLEELYNKEELCPGRVIELPWEGKDGKSVGWRVVIVGIPAPEQVNLKFITLCACCIIIFSTQCDIDNYSYHVSVCRVYYLIIIIF